MSLLFDALADAQLAALDPAARVYQRINDALDRIEDDPGDKAVRARRYNNPPLWGVPVRVGDDDWLVLWREESTGPVVAYIGPDI